MAKYILKSLIVLSRCRIIKIEIKFVFHDRSIFIENLNEHKHAKHSKNSKHLLP